MCVSNGVAVVRVSVSHVNNKHTSSSCSWNWQDTREEQPGFRAWLFRIKVLFNVNSAMSMEDPFFVLKGWVFLLTKLIVLQNNSLSMLTAATANKTTCLSVDNHQMLTLSTGAGWIGVHFNYLLMGWNVYKVKTNEGNPKVRRLAPQLVLRCLGDHSSEH